jgi:glyoxylase-like metal-dependent hydrolase (beta-lactamase superfamily II)
MIETIRPGLNRVEIPLPNNPLKYVNSYFIQADGKTLIVDTGLNRDECRQAMLEAMEALEVDRGDLYFFITHLHADHFGLVAGLDPDPGRVYFSRPETEIIESWPGWEPMIAYAAENGFPEDRLRAALADHPGFKYAAKWTPDMRIIDDGDRVEIGDFHFTCVTTPGHTRGHVCLYEPDLKILIAGDHILRDITPNIQCWSDGENPLGDYLDSLDKVETLDVDLVLPGHRRLIHDMKARLDQLRAHHRDRLEEVEALAAQRPRTAFEAAADMSWDLEGGWDDFPLIQKWFATAEATAHLRHLETNGRLERVVTQGRAVYHPAG